MFGLRHLIVIVHYFVSCKYKYYECVIDYLQNPSAVSEIREVSNILIEK